MSAIVVETVEVRPSRGAAFPAPPPGGSSRNTPRLALAWHVHQSVRPLQPRVLDRLPPDEDGVICATVETLGRPFAAVASTGAGPWQQQWWLGPAASSPRTVYLQTSAV